MIRAFLAFLETRGMGQVAAHELRETLAADGEAARAALVAEGVIRVAPLATTHACDGLGCAREVRERPRGTDGARRFLAVCTRSPRECETVHLAEDELSQDAIVPDAFSGMVRRALRIDAPLGAARTTRAGALSGSEAPVLLGEQVHGGASRDVFFAQRPSAPALHALLAERRHLGRATLVLVPTGRGIDPELLARHYAGHVEIAVLADLLAVRNGKVVAPAPLRIVPPMLPRSAETRATSPANDARRSVAPDGLPRAERWGDVTFYLVDDERCIGVEIDRRHRRLTAIDLGLARERTREPVRAFDLLRRICEGNGVFDTRPWGGRENGKQIVSELRKALSAAFEIPGSPIESYSRSAKSWKTRFRAFAAKPSVVREVESALAGGRGRRGGGRSGSEALPDDPGGRLTTDQPRTSAPPITAPRAALPVGTPCAPSARA